MVINYHVFTDAWDENTRNYSEALQIAIRMQNETGKVRIYEEQYESEEDLLSDVMLKEDCIYSYGSYPM